MVYVFAGKCTPTLQLYSPSPSTQVQSKMSGSQTAKKCLTFLEDLGKLETWFNKYRASWVFAEPRDRPGRRLTPHPRLHSRNHLEERLMQSRLTCQGFATFLAVALTTAAFGPIAAGSGEEPSGAKSSEYAQISVAPRESKLIGHRATQQLIATGKAADGSIMDLTRSVEWASSNQQVAVVSAQGRVTPVGNGTATIIARNSVSASATVIVEGMKTPRPVSFRRDVIPALSQSGCNTGACHGTPTGKGGFRLSLRGYLPDQDFAVLSRVGWAADQSPRRRHQPLAAQAAGPGSARGWLAAGSQLEVVRVRP